MSAKRRPGPLAISLLALAASGVVQARAVLFYSTGDPAFNTNAPAGALAGSGWQHEGQWLWFLGTPIASNLFITAKHVGGNVGDTFWLGGVGYATVARFLDPDSDLAIWKVCDAFPSYAPLYPDEDEVGKPLVVFGRGTRRGDPVLFTNGANAEVRGWLWSVQDGVQRWGENKVTAIFDGGLGAGPLLVAEFDAGVGPNEAALSSGDSGGAVFILTRGRWRLAGINYGVSGPYNLNSSGFGFYASLFDARGYYEFDVTGWQPVPASDQPQPGGFAATRISAHLAWINQVIADEAGSPAAPVLQGADKPAGPYSDEPGAVISPAAGKVTLAAPSHPRFYRLRHCRQLRLIGIVVRNGQLELTFGEPLNAPGG